MASRKKKPRASGEEDLLVLPAQIVDEVDLADNLKDLVKDLEQPPAVNKTTEFARTDLDDDDDDSDDRSPTPDSQGRS